MQPSPRSDATDPGHGQPVKSRIFLLHNIPVFSDPRNHSCPGQPSAVCTDPSSKAILNINCSRNLQEPGSGPPVSFPGQRLVTASCIWIRAVASIIKP